jgi:hypothetical protein
MQLRFLVKSKAGRCGQPPDGATVEKCEYLMQVAALTRDEGFLPQELFEKVKAFNAARILAIHKLLTGTVAISESQSAASLVSPLYKEIQHLWLKITIAEQRVAGDEAAMRSVIVHKGIFSTGDNEGYREAPEALLRTLGDVRYAAFVSSQSSEVRDAALGLVLRTSKISHAGTQELRSCIAHGSEVGITCLTSSS